MSVYQSWDGLGLAPWHEVVDGYAVPEPTRPLDLRLFPSLDDREKEMRRILGVDSVNERSVFDYGGRRLRIRSWQLPKKLADVANHAAYASWIEAALRDPLEVWRHRDPRNPSSDERLYYLAAYIGPAGSTSFQVIAGLSNSAIFNAFRLDRYQNAEDSRFGDLLHIGYSPAQPPLPKQKGAPFPAAPFGS